MLKITETPEGVSFHVRVLPRSSRNEIAGVLEGALKVKLTAPPVEGAANKLLIKFLAGILKVAKSDVTIVSGESSRSKAVEVRGVGKDEALSLLG